MYRSPVLLSLLLCVALWMVPARAGELEAGFADPPPEARTRCFWWWLESSVTEAAITRDLEEMAAKGYGGALIFDAGSSAYRTVEKTPAGPLFGSEEWTKLFVHAVREADRLGLELGLNIQSGWNLGGPNVTPEEAAKQLTWRETTVEGPRAGGFDVPAPEGRGGFYRDAAVVAFRQRDVSDGPPTPAPSAGSEEGQYPAALAVDGDNSTFWVSGGQQPGEGPTAEHPEWLQLNFQSPVTVSGARVLGRTGYGPRAGRLEVADGGGPFRVVAAFEAGEGQSADLSFDPVKADAFRLVMTASSDPRYPQQPRNVQVAEWVLTDPAGTSVAGPGGARPIQDLDLKAGFHELGGSAPDCRGLLSDVPAAPGEEDAAAGDVLNLTPKLREDGTLDWDVPEGRWTVLRFGYTLTGARVSTASGDWQGPVLDYMSTPVLEAYWDRNVQPLLDAVGPLSGTALRWLHTDSWECGGMNWTPGFEGMFQDLTGYDIAPWLPVFAGKIIESRDASNRFLADFRKAVAACVADRHYARFQAMAHARGLLVHPESGGPHAGPLDGITNLGRSDMPMGEFWVPSPHRPRPEQRFFVKQAASTAHIYGLNRVAAEAFTSIGPHWEDSLWRAAKPSFDHEACAGLNLSYIHTFTCSPAEMGLPGQEYFAGTHFNPNVTWWDLAAGPVVAYLNRCHFLLQQGTFVADVCYYYGDHVPNIAQRKEADPAGALPGYDYDVLNEEALLNRLRCVNGLLALPGGMRYRVLVLPDHGILSLDALDRVDQLVRDGATVLGPKPARTASLSGGAVAEARFSALADGLWGTPAQAAGQRAVGQGRVAWGMTARELLAMDHVPYDCAWDGADDAFGYLHRRTDEADIYFVSSRSEAPTEANFAFRVTGKQPELWDPLTGTVRPATRYTLGKVTTSVPLAFAPYGSVFVILREPGAGGDGPPPSPTYSFELAAPWTVAFDPAWGGPAETQFPELVSWTERPEDGIRFYSGTAVYTQTFEVAPDLLAGGGAWSIDLGEVREVASVRLNGRDLGVAWTPPFRVDVSEALVAGENRLEVRVVNNWPNRLIGDAALPEEQRLTRTNVISFKPDSPLTPSGLLGPVRLMRQDPAD